MNKMVVKEDLVKLKDEINVKTKDLIAEAVAPITSDIADLKTRMSNIETSGVSGSASSNSPSTNKTVKDLQQLLNNMDPARKRVALIGFTDTGDASTRVKSIETYMQTHFAQFKYVVVENFDIGPWSNRIASKASYIEFVSVDRASKFCKHVKATSNSKITISGCEIIVKYARTKFNEQRNTSIRNASDLIKKHIEGKDKSVVIKWDERQVEVNGTVAFEQLKTETGGSFKAPFGGIVLP